MVDFRFLKKKNYIVVPNQKPDKAKNEYYFSKTLFKNNKKGEIKQFFIIQVLQDKITHKYTTYNSKGIFHMERDGDMMSIVLMTHYWTNMTQSINTPKKVLKKLE